MRVFESWVLVYLFNSLWQVPLVFCAALAAARLARQAGPRMEHRVWVIALLLEVTLPLCHFHLSEGLRQLWGMMPWLRPSGAADGEIQIFFAPGAMHGITAPLLPEGALAAIVAIYMFSLLFYAGRLGWGLWTTNALLREATGIALAGEAAQKLHFCGQFFGINGNAVRLAASPVLPGPATLGVRRHTLLLPAGFIEQVSASDLDAVLAHEFAHIRRQDFAKNLLYGMLSLPIAYHPLLSLTRARIAETRELVCDAMAVDALPGRESYARSLLRMAAMLTDRKTPRLLHAIGILDANIFERRVMNLTRNTGTMGHARRSLIIAACGVIALATCISAMSLQTDTPAPPAQKDAENKVNLSPNEMVKNLLTKVAPVYPPEAKAAGVQGTVVLEATINKEGRVENLKVISGPEMLQKASLDAVKNWVYKPYLLNGSPVEVKTTINIIFTLGDKAPTPPAQNNTEKTDKDRQDEIQNNLITRVDPVYPALAKKDKIDGIVLLSLVIGKDGVPKDIKIEKSMRGDYDRSAIEAVRQYRWKPYDNPVEVELKMEIQFKRY
jgi:TonB family protein